LNGQSADGNRLIAISHTSEQNGDLMRDPERVFEIHAHGMAEPLSFRNDYMGLMEEKTRKGIFRTIAPMQHLRFNNLRAS